MADETIRGADILVRTLQRFGVDRIFSLSGNHIMPVFDAALDGGIELVHARHATFARGIQQRREAALLVIRLTGGALVLLVGYAVARQITVPGAALVVSARVRAGAMT